MPMTEVDYKTAMGHRLNTATQLLLPHHPYYSSLGTEACIIITAYHRVQSIKLQCDFKWPDVIPMCWLGI